MLHCLCFHKALQLKTHACNQEPDGSQIFLIKRDLLTYSRTQQKHPVIMSGQFTLFTALTSFIVVMTTMIATSSAVICDDNTSHVSAMTLTTQASCVTRAMTAMTTSARKLFVISI